MKHGGGAHFQLSHAHIPTQIFQYALCIVCWPKHTSLNSSQCLECVRQLHFMGSSLSHLRAENVHSEVTHVGTKNWGVCSPKFLIFSVGGG